MRLECPIDDGGDCGDGGGGHRDGGTCNCADGGKGDGEREQVVEDGRDGGGGAGSFARS